MRIEVFLEATLTAINADMTPPKSPDEVNCENFILDFQCSNDTQISVCLEMINKTLSRIYNQYSDVEQTAYIDALWAFLHNLNIIPSLSIGLMAAPIFKLNLCGMSTRIEFYRELKHLIDKYGKDETIWR